MRNLILAVSALLVAGCMGYPDTVTPVQGFELERYLGTWYEIARLDHPFERGLERVTATYSLRDDGGVRVRNRGYSPEEEAWSEAEGRAYLVREPDEGYLKVTFFWPFYASYVIFELDREGYRHAFVTSSSRSYLWLLARTPTVSEELKERFVREARERGYPVEELIFVEHRQAE